MKNSNPRDKSSFDNQGNVPRLNTGTSIVRIHSASGFTLVELMISLTLGLIVVAAAIQLFITGVTSYKLQKAMTHIQDNASLGLNFIIDDIRKANLSSPVPALNDQIAYAGVLLNSKNVGDKIDLNCNTCFKDGKITSLGNANALDKNKNQLQNDQLIIRYQAPQTSFDCSGNTLAKDTFVVQRYYVGSTSTDMRRSLRCQAAQYTQAQLDAVRETKLRLNWENSQVILPNVDFFQVRLGYMEGGLNNSSNALAYIDIHNYMSLATKDKNIDGVIQQIRPHVHAVQIGVLVQSEDATGNQAIIKERNDREFQVLGAPVKLKTEYQDTRLRQAVGQTISLRNAMGWVEEGCLIVDKSNPHDCTRG